MTQALTLELASTPSIPKLYGRAVIARKKGLKRGQSLPNIGARQHGVTADPSRVAEYAKVCGFSRTDVLPLTYPFIAAFPLHIQMMTHDTFPLPLLGLVHVRNRIVQNRPISVRESVDFECRITDTQTVDKGLEFQLTTWARVGSETAWECVSTILRRLPGGEKSQGERKQPPAPLSGSQREDWEIPADIGRRYGRVSGDLNPIHLAAFTAKAFGFPRAIAHGMWSKARCVAALSDLIGTQPVEVDVRFKLPVLLPTKAAFVADRKPEATNFELQSAKGDKVHLSGTLRAL
jgi:hypothetical protein